MTESKPPHSLSLIVSSLLIQGKQCYYLCMRSLPEIMSPDIQAPRSVNRPFYFSQGSTLFSVFFLSKICHKDHSINTTRPTSFFIKAAWQFIIRMGHLLCNQADGNLSCFLSWILLQLGSWHIYLCLHRQVYPWKKVFKNELLKE